MQGRFRFGPALFWAATWGVGVAFGVALGGWLTVVGGSAAPGVESLQVFEDLLVVPGFAGLVVFAVHLAGQMVLSRIRRDSTSSDGGGED